MATTPVAKLVHSSFQHTKGLHRDSGFELYWVSNITGWTRANTADAVYTALPIQIGSVHPDLPRALCVFHSVRRRITTRTTTAAPELAPIEEALVAVIFDTNHSEAVSSRSSGVVGYTGTVRVPNWTPTTFGGQSVWVPSDTIEPREYLRRVETRYVRDGALSENVRLQIYNRVGAVFVLPQNTGIPYLLKSPSIIDMPNGLTRLVYTFETSCQMLARSVDLPNGQAVNLPYLDFLQEWFQPLGIAVGGDPPPVVVRPWQTRYPFVLNSTLPYL